MLRRRQANSTSSPKIFPVKVSTRYHIGPASFTAKEDKIFFALTRIPEVIKKVKGQPSTIHVEIYSSKMGPGGKWNEPVPFFLNNANSYSVGDPFITSKGDTLYFSSDKPGGNGGMDIYFCTRKTDDNWNAPVNIKEINTSGDERSPARDKTGTLYFSSNGHTGLGGLDIYTKTGSGNITNLGYPLNSPADDFAFSLNPDQSGLLYLSSNRDGGKGQDDIYKVLNEKSLFWHQIKQMKKWPIHH